jgi:hypothetical protein
MNIFNQCPGLEHPQSLGVADDTPRYYWNEWLRRLFDGSAVGIT